MTIKYNWNMSYSISLELDYYKKALDISPQHIGALLGIGKSLEKLGNRSAAIEYYKQAVSASIPLALAKQPWLLSERADALTYLGNYSR
jgi:tetratricopeptide (TPR) repeat protein